MTRLLRPLAFVLALAAPVGIAIAQNKPKGKYSHPNLAAADRLCAQAYAKLEAAANESDIGGHAKKAKNLLKQAQDEIKLATQAAAKE